MLTAIEGRVLGCLLEKEQTTPEQYPLTMNALVLACNQTSGRDPVMTLCVEKVDAALTSLKAQGLVRLVHPSHGRSVTRYRQVADIGTPEHAALVAVLLLRGPQTTVELRSRTERLQAFAGTDDVDAALRALRSVEPPTVQLLDRATGQRDQRWQQLLAVEVERIMRAAPASSRALAGNDAEVESTHARLSELEARVARLEAALAELL